MQRRADSLFDYAVSVSGCERPLIALNELWGASLPTPLTPTAERYRANVLRFVTRLVRARRPAGAARLERAFHRRRRRSVVEGDRTGVRHRAREVREREPDLARRGGRRVATPAHRLSVVRGEAVRDRHPAVSRRPHDRLPDRGRRREGGRACSRVHGGSTWRSGRRSRPSRCPVSSASPTSGRGAGRSATSARTIRTRRSPRASGSGRGIRISAMHPRSSARSSTPTGAPARSTFRPEFAACTTDSPLTASGVAALAKVTGDRELALTALVVRAVERQRANGDDGADPRHGAPNHRLSLRREHSVVSCGSGRRRGRASQSRVRSSATSCAAPKLQAELVTPRPSTCRRHALPHDVRRSPGAKARRLARAELAPGGHRARARDLGASWPSSSWRAVAR